MVGVLLAEALANAMKHKPKAYNGTSGVTPLSQTLGNALLNATGQTP